MRGRGRLRWWWRERRAGRTHVFVHVEAGRGGLGCERGGFGGCAAGEAGLGEEVDDVGAVVQRVVGGGVAVGVEVLLFAGDLLRVVEAGGGAGCAV